MVGNELVLCGYLMTSGGDKWLFIIHYLDLYGKKRGLMLDVSYTTCLSVY